MVVVFCFDKGKECWDYPTIQNKLWNLAHAKKGKHWVHHNLSLSDSSCIGRSFWEFAQHFSCLRHLYSINPGYSKTLLEKLWKVIKTVPNDDLRKLYFQAVANFEAITDYPVNIVDGMPSGTVSPYVPIMPETHNTHILVPPPEPIFPAPLPAIRVLPSWPRQRRQIVPFNRGRILPPSQVLGRQINDALRTRSPFGAERQVQGTGWFDQERREVPLSGPRIARGKVFPRNRSEGIHPRIVPSVPRVAGGNFYEGRTFPQNARNRVAPLQRVMPTIPERGLAREPHPRGEYAVPGRR